MLGNDKWEFGRNYCTGKIDREKHTSVWRHHLCMYTYGLHLHASLGIRYQNRSQGRTAVLKALYDGCRYDEELHNMLRKTVMVRRLKSQVRHAPVLAICVAVSFRFMPP